MKIPVLHKLPCRLWYGGFFAILADLVYIAHYICTSTDTLMVLSAREMLLCMVHALVVLVCGVIVLDLVIRRQGSNRA